MGWGSGANLADKLWKDIYKYIPADRRQDAARTFVYHFENYDCDQMLETEVGQVAGIECNEEQGSHWGDWYYE